MIKYSGIDGSQRETKVVKLQDRSFCLGLLKWTEDVSSVLHGIMVAAVLNLVISSLPPPFSAFLPWYAGGPGPTYLPLLKKTVDIEDILAQ